tara:strand:- start:1557 stop:1967 length:411 start_codon:yes stop_codon:yes gene_type:complete
MAEPQEEVQSQVQFLLSDFNTRLRDAEERNQLVRERILLLGKNLIESKQETESDIKELKKQTSEIKKDLEKLQRLSENIVQETKKFVKKNEVVVIERMLKDFQPLEFMRKKDVEELIKEKLKTKTNLIKEPEQPNK